MGKADTSSRKWTVGWRTTVKATWRVFFCMMMMMVMMTMMTMMMMMMMMIMGRPVNTMKVETWVAANMGLPKSHFRVCWFLSVGALSSG